MFDALERQVEDKDVAELSNRFDRILFGARGSLAQSIKGQSGRGDENWDELSDEYFDWKAGMMVSGETIDNETPPNKVISTDIWIRTGKFLQFTKTIGNGKFKKIRVHPELIFKNRAFWEVYTNNVNYWVRADAMRKIAFFTDEDKKKIGSIFGLWMRKLMTKALQGRAAARRG